MLETIIPSAHAAFDATSLSEIFSNGLIGGDRPFSEIVTNLVTFVLYLGAILAVIYLVYAGIQYVTASGDAEKAKLARQGIINAIIGIVVILIAVALVTWVSGIVGSGNADTGARLPLV